MTRAEISQMIVTMIMAKLQAEGRTVEQLTKDEMDVLAEDATELVKIAMDATGEKLEP